MPALFFVAALLLQDVGQCIRDLGDDDPRVRDKAAEWLSAQGLNVRKSLEEALDKAADPEIQSRLKLLLAKIYKDHWDIVGYERLAADKTVLKLEIKGTEILRDGNAVTEAELRTLCDGHRGADLKEVLRSKHESKYWILIDADATAAYGPFRTILKTALRATCTPGIAVATERRLAMTYRLVYKELQASVESHVLLEVAIHLCFDKDAKAHLAQTQEHRAKAQGPAVWAWVELDVEHAVDLKAAKSMAALLERTAQLYKAAERDVPIVLNPDPLTPLRSVIQVYRAVEKAPYPQIEFEHDAFKSVEEIMPKKK